MRTWIFFWAQKNDILISEHDHKLDFYWADFDDQYLDFITDANILVHFVDACFDIKMSFFYAHRIPMYAQMKSTPEIADRV